MLPLRPGQQDQYNYVLFNQWAPPPRGNNPNGKVNLRNLLAVFL